MDEFQQGLPYGRIDPEEKRRRSQELLAKYSRQWTAQVQEFVQGQPKKNVNKPRTSVMQMDYQWREHQRQLAKKDVEQRQAQEFSWQHSLRTDERLVEFKLGKVNQVGFFRKMEPYSIAVKNLIEMPEYVSVEDKLDPDLAQYNRDIARKQIENSVFNQLPDENIELPVDNVEQYSQKVESVLDKAQLNISTESPVDHVSGELQRALSQQIKAIGNEAQKAEIIAQKILDRNEVKMDDALLAQKQFNKNTSIDPIFYNTEFCHPVVSVNNLTCICSNNDKMNTCSLQVKNVGDCTVQLSMRQKELTQAQHEQQLEFKKEAKLQNTKQFDSFNENRSKSCAGERNYSTTLPQANQSIYQRVNKHLTTIKELAQESGMQTTPFAKQREMNWQVAARPKSTKSKQVEMLQIEKSATPAHLRILANRYVAVERGNIGSKIIVATPGNRWLVNSMSTSEVKFVFPSQGERQQPGIILQEYELTCFPRVDVLFKSPDDQKSGHNSVIQYSDHTSIFIRCYGISSQCLQLSKQLVLNQQQGQKIIDSFYEYSMCEELVYEYVDIANDFSDAKMILEKQNRIQKKEDSAKAEAIVKHLYSNNIMKAKWLQDKKQIKLFLYDLVEEQLGFKMQISQATGQINEIDLLQQFGESFQNFVNRINQEMVNSLLNKRRNEKEGDEKIETLPLEFLQFMKNSAFHFLSVSSFSKTLGFHYQYEDLAVFDRFRQNSASILRNRLLALSGENLEVCNIVLSQTSDAEKWLMRRAISSDKSVVPLFTQFKNNKLVNLLINKANDLLLQIVSQQIFISKQQQQATTINQLNQLKSRKRPGYDQNFVNLLLLVSSIAVQTPVIDVFNILKIKSQLLTVEQAPSISIVGSPNRLRESVGLKPNTDENITMEQHELTQPKGQDIKESEFQDNYTELKQFLSGFLSLLKLKELLYNTTIKIIEEESKKKEQVKKGEDPVQKVYLRQLLGEVVNKYVYSYNDNCDYRVDYQHNVNQLFQVKTSIDTIEFACSLIMDNIPITDECRVQPEDIEKIGSTIAELLRREQQYVLTIKNRRFLQLYFSDVTSVNLVDPFEIASKFPELMKSNYFISENQEVLSDHYHQVFSIFEKGQLKMDLFAEMQSELKAKLASRVPTATDQDKKRVTSKALVQKADLPPLPHPYNQFYARHPQCEVDNFTHTVNGYHYQLDQIAQNAATLTQKDLKTTKKDAKPAEKLLNLVKQVGNRRFADNEQLNDLLAFILVQKMDFSQFLFQPMGRITMQEMLVDLVLLIVQISALPDHPYFSQVSIVVQVQELQQVKEDLNQQRVKFAEQLVEQIVKKPDVGKEGKAVAVKKSQVEPVDQLLEQKQKNVQILLKELLSSVSYFPANLLVSQYCPPKLDEVLEEKQLNANSSMMLLSLAQLPALEFGQVVKKFGQSGNYGNAILAPQKEMYHDGLVSENMSEVQKSVDQWAVLTEGNQHSASQEQLVESQQVHNLGLNEEQFSEEELLEEEISPLDLPHEMRLLVMKEEFDLFLDAVLTGHCEQCNQQYLEQLQEFDDNFNDWDIQRQKMLMVKNGELTMNEANLDEDEYQDPDTMVPPKTPLPVDQYETDIAELKKMADAVQKQNVLYFSLSYSSSSTLELVKILVNQLKATVQEGRKYLQIIYENDYKDLKIDEFLDKFLKDVADHLCVDAKEEFGVECAELAVATPLQKTKAPKDKQSAETSEFRAAQPYNLLPADQLFSAANYLGQLFGLKFTADAEYAEQAASFCRNVFNMELPASGIIDPAPLKSLFEFQQLKISHYISNNPAKLACKPSVYALLQGPGGLYEQTAQLVEPGVLLIQTDNEFLKQFFETNAAKLALPARDKKKDAKKPDTGSKDKRKSIGGAQPVPVEQEDHQEKEGEEEENWYDDEEHLPPYLKEVELPTQARRKTWAWLLNQALERAMTRFEAVEKADRLFQRAANYLARPLEEMYDH